MLQPTEFHVDDEFHKPTMIFLDELNATTPEMLEALKAFWNLPEVPNEPVIPHG